MVGHRSLKPLYPSEGGCLGSNPNRGTNKQIIDYMDIFLEQLDIPVKSEKVSIQGFLCTIEGWKTRIKNLHWAANKMNTHKLLDEIADFVGGYQDSLAEDYMGITGKVEPTFLRGIPCECEDVKSLLKEIESKTLVFYEKVSEATIYKGIKSETETFIHTINKYKYLSTLCD